MLPPALSEDVVSLNAQVPRRSLVFGIKLDSQALPVSTTLSRARIVSRAKLSYRRVQEYYDGKEPEASKLSGKDFTETLDLLKVVGALRIKEAESRDVVRYDRIELAIDLTVDSVAEFHLTTEKRYDTDRYNEQISLLCNREGAQFLERDAEAHPEVQAIYRVHDAPNENRFGGVDKFIRDLIRVRGLDREVWDWKDQEGEPVSAYLERLPSATEEDRRIKAAIERQFLVINVRSTYSGTPGLHYGERGFWTLVS
jgi:ribonuclease R